MLLPQSANDNIQLQFLLKKFYEGWKIFPLRNFTTSLDLQHHKCDCKMGWSCPTPGKHPLIQWTDLSVYPDAKDIEVLFLAGFRNWGVHLGHSGLVVIDVDTRAGGEAGLASLMTLLGPLPDTFMVETSGRGRHVYFRANSQIDPVRGFVSRDGDTVTKVLLAPGVEMFAGNHYVVLPYSVHKSRVVYRILNEHDPVPLMEPRHAMDRIPAVSYRPVTRYPFPTEPSTN